MCLHRYYVCGVLGTLYSLFSRQAFFALLALIAAANGVLLYAAKGLLQRAMIGS